MKAEWIERYSRQVLLPEIGYEGQKRLAKARVLIVGIGGLGAPAAAYLAGAGIGTLGLVDDGTVERSNLHRQVLYTEADIGQLKAVIAAERLSALNPDVTLVPFALRLTAGNARALISEYDFVVDGSDNFVTRYIINDACFFEDKPWAYASLYRSYGQLSVFHPPRSPCYRCLFPSAPAEAVPDCAQAGVLGPLPGVLGGLQALEAMKTTAGFGKTALGLLLSVDLETLTFSRLSIKRNSACRLCGDSPTIADMTEEATRVCLTDNPRPAVSSPETRSARPTTPPHLALPEDSLEVDPETVAALLKSSDSSIVLLDVREQEEVQFCRLNDSVWVPLTLLPVRAGELDNRCAIIAYCHTGGRSLVAARWLRDNGFARAYSLAGGIDRWAEQVDPSIPRY